ncbi:MAG: hypothetical protein M9890_05215 [Thermomicrobiales bacterium]|nr:hypothetical protein [Thermomicrobiales bacterium]
MTRRTLLTLPRIILLLMLVTALAACSGPDSAESTDGTDAASTATTVTSEPTAPGATGDTTAPPTPTTDASGEEPTATTEPAADPTETTEPTATVIEPTATTAVSAGDDTEGLLPNHRIISFYGHPNSEQMGILGEYSIPDLHAKLAEQAAAYEAADPSHPTVLAFEMIATVAQPWPGDDGTYVAYSGDELIQDYVDYATAHDMIVILDLQIGWDSIPHQIEVIRHWLELPNVHVALDPEFSTKANETVPNDRIPGEFIGEADGNDIQKAVEMLSQIVAEKQIPSKILILHQFESEMIFNKDAITPLPGVDIVLDMDGFGGPDAKLGNYDHFVTQELIEYGGIKLFYRQDDPLLTPEQIVALDPPALVVIYQ